MTELTYAVRPSFSIKERTYCLGEDALSWKYANGRGGLLDLADVNEVRLTVNRSHLGRSYARCVLRTKHEGNVKIESPYLFGSGAPCATYGPFVRALVARIGKVAPQAKFMAGRTERAILWLVLAIFLTFIVLTLIVGLIRGAELTGGTTVFLVVLAIQAIGGWHMAYRERAKSFDPSNPPAQLLSGALPE